MGMALSESAGSSPVLNKHTVVEFKCFLSAIQKLQSLALMNSESDSQVFGERPPVASPLLKLEPSGSLTQAQPPGRI